MKSFGIILIAIGILMMVVTGFSLTTKKNVADIGPVEISKKETHPIYWSPIAGAAITGVGIVLLILSQRKNK
jgi:hypothetical protein